MADNFIGKWKLVESEKFDEYLQVLSLIGFQLVIKQLIFRRLELDMWWGRWVHCSIRSCRSKWTARIGSSLMSALSSPLRQVEIFSLSEKLKNKFLRIRSWEGICRGTSWRTQDESQFFLCKIFSLVHVMCGILVTVYIRWREVDPGATEDQTRRQGLTYRAIHWREEKSSDRKF